ncbi:hypothetical protein K4A83_06410 [Spirulina subsalsa FACHB-351]|uniref:Uncharacterized protein n=1 Tax=Spirulina subsalsa FACHB-351 TaxID=234711 RepID=A0ABT3L472_9CYAN|nr:hypothetical protein [Spirulina subsalsa]MCW6035904.1 hypothetical protein [Spirulina subsalsa FACHB-351]
MPVNIIHLSENDVALLQSIKKCNKISKPKILLISEYMAINLKRLTNHGGHLRKQYAISVWESFTSQIKVLDSLSRGRFELEYSKDHETVMMMPATSPTIQDVYAYITRILPPTALLQLAALILNGLTQQNNSVVDDSDTWTEQDQLELAAFSLQHFSTTSLGNEETSE